MTSRWIAALAAAVWAGLIRLGAHAQAAACVWRNVKVGGGRFILGVAVSLVAPGLVYARSDMGGGYRFASAAGRCIPLQDAKLGSSVYGGESIAPDLRDDGVVYAAVGMSTEGLAAILRSCNRAET